MTTFKCKRSGNFVSFTNVNDIEGMRKHEGFTEIIDAETPKTIQTGPSETSTKKMLKLKPRAPVPAFLQD